MILIMTMIIVGVGDDAAAADDAASDDVDVDVETYVGP